MKTSFSILTFLTITTLSTFGQIKKCDVTTVSYTSKKVGQLTKDDIRTFLLTLGAECESNIEFGEFSNEVLFLVLDKHTELTLKTIESEKRQIELDEILSILSSPVNDGIDVKRLIPKVENVKFDRRLKKQVLDSLRVALTRM
jgi:hypothetical protein